MGQNTSFPQAMGTELSSAEEGRAVASLQAEDWHLDASGTVHGGVISALIRRLDNRSPGHHAKKGEQPFTI